MRWWHAGNVRWGGKSSDIWWIRGERTLNKTRTKTDHDKQLWFLRRLVGRRHLFFSIWQTGDPCWSWHELYHGPIIFQYLEKAFNRIEAKPLRRHKQNVSSWEGDGFTWLAKHKNASICHSCDRTCVVVHESLEGDPMGRPHQFGQANQLALKMWPVKATHWSRLVKMNKVVCKFKKGNIKLNKIIIYITITL